MRVVLVSTDSEPFQHGRSPQGWSQRVRYVHVKLYHKHSVSGAHCVQTLISVSALELTGFCSGCFCFLSLQELGAYMFVSVCVVLGVILLGDKANTHIHARANTLTRAPKHTHTPVSYTHLTLPTMAVV